MITVLKKLPEPEQMLIDKKIRFSNYDLMLLILPIIAERFLSMLIGITDTLMLTYAGETTVSGVSLVNQLNNIFIFVFGAIATGGAVISSQYVGKGDKRNSIISASQLIMFTSLLSVIIMIFVGNFREQLLSFLFGNVEADVMNSANVYLGVIIFSFPLIAIYNSGTALFRSMSKSGTVLCISIIMNIINIVGNAIAIFVLNKGVIGVAIASIISRLFSAIVIFTLLFIKKNYIHITFREIFKWNSDMLKRILHIAVPNGIETGLFQISKVAISGIVALFGTTQITANAVAQDFWSMSNIFCTALGHVFLTVIGQCMGASNVEEAVYYNKKLLRITYIGSILWNTLILILTPTVLSLYDLSDETRQLVILLVFMLNIVNALLCPLDFSLPSGLRAAGDTKYTMFASVFSTVICRVLFSVLFAIRLNMGVVGIVIAMICDRIIKSILIYTRYHSRKWTKHKVI